MRVVVMTVVFVLHHPSLRRGEVRACGMGRASKSLPLPSLAAHSTKAAGTKFAELPKLENRTLSEAENVNFLNGFEQSVMTQSFYNLLIRNKLTGGVKLHFGPLIFWIFKITRQSYEGIF